MGPTETLIERPKKAKTLLLRKEEEAHAKEPNCCERKKSTNYVHSVCE